MTDKHHDTQARNAEKALARENRRRIRRFVFVFVATVLVMLTSYRYAIHTRLNDWYLFQAARHTGWVLDKVGHAQVEAMHYGRHNPQEIRALLAAWRAGRDEAAPEEIAAAPKHLLSAWERWSHRAIQTRRTGQLRQNGPRVYFVLRSGISTEIDSLRGQIYRIESDLSLEETDKAERLQPLREQLQELSAKHQAIRTGADTEHEDTSLTFAFILVPECGAIEIMAIFLAAVFAFPTLWRKRLVGIVGGVPIMYGVNVFRLTVLAVIGALDKSRIWFNFAHEYVWQAIYIIFVVIVWLLWVEYIVKRKRS